MSTEKKTWEWHKLESSAGQCKRTKPKVGVKIRLIQRFRELWNWQMTFDPDKCEHIRITNKRKIIQTTYKIHGQVLKETTKAKYLGVTIDKTLSLNSHIDMATKGADQTISFLHRNLSSRPKEIKEASYKTFIRPQLEYAALVWDPSTITDINKVETVQRRAARFCQNDYRQTCSVHDSESEMGRSAISR